MASDEKNTHAARNAYETKVSIKVVETDEAYAVDEAITSYSEKNIDSIPEELKHEASSYRCWVIVMAALLGAIFPQGLSSSWGVMLAYFQREVFGSSKEVTTQLATIGSLRNLILMAAMVPLNIVYSRVGPKAMIIMSVILTTSGIMLISMANELWQLYLFYSIFSGFGGSMFQLTIFRILPQWFDERKRSTAFGIFFCSFGLGGIIVPSITTVVENRLGGPWIFRILAISAFTFGTIACIVISENRQVSGVSDVNGEDKKATDFSIIKAKNMGLYVACIFIQTCVQIVPNVFLPSYAKHIGLVQWQQNATTMVLLGMNILGAVFAGITADRIGNINTIIIFTSVALLSTCFIWTSAYNFQTLEAYCAVYGLFANVMLTLNTPVVISLIGIERYPSAISLVLLTNLLSAFGPTAASAIEGLSHMEPFFSYKIFNAVGLATSLLIQLTVRVRKEKSWLAKV